MLYPPKTIDEAKKLVYAQWSGNPKGYPYIIGRCAYGVWQRWWNVQCERKNGHGPDNLYCKQHAKKVNAKEE